MLPSLDDYIYAKNIWCQLISSKNIYDKIIMQSDWMSGIPGSLLPKVEVSDATFSWWLSLCQKSKINTDAFKRYWWSKNPAIWLAEKHNQPKVVILDTTFFDNCLHAKKLRYHLILSRNIDHQRILLSTWMRGKIGPTKPEVKVFNPSYLDDYLYVKSLKYWIIL